MRGRSKAVIIISVFFVILITSAVTYNDPTTRLNVKKILGIMKEPITSQEIKIEEFVIGLRAPTTMTFVDDNILFFEKYTGKVRLIKNGVLIDEPLLDLDVSSAAESGGLGILALNSTVFVYFTEAENDGGNIIGDSIYRYSLSEDKLVDPILVNRFPVFDPSHHGGSMTRDSKGGIYVVRGDQLIEGKNKEPGILQNFNDGPIDDNGVIIRVGINDLDITPSLSSDPFEHYYAIGIRNSFGISFDPLTDYLWETENGSQDNDEVNLVLPNFNSGWAKVMGPANKTQLESLPKIGKFVYSDPEFTWEEPVAPTAITFAGMNWGNQFQDKVFVGSCVGKIFQFTLNSTRTGFIFESDDLKDLVLNKGDNSEEITFLDNLGCITDIKFGSDGSMYVVSFANNGIIYKITPE